MAAKRNYLVTVEATITKTIEVYASSPKEAEKRANAVASFTVYSKERCNQRTVKVEAR